VPSSVWYLRDRRLKTEDVIRRRTVVTTQQLSAVLAYLTELHVCVVLLLLRTVLLLPPDTIGKFAVMPPALIGGRYCYYYCYYLQ